MCFSQKLFPFIINRNSIFNELDIFGIWFTKGGRHIFGKFNFLWLSYSESELYSKVGSKVLFVYRHVHISLISLITKDGCPQKYKIEQYS